MQNADSPRSMRLCSEHVQYHVRVSRLPLAYSQATARHLKQLHQPSTCSSPPSGSIQSTPFVESAAQKFTPPRLLLRPLESWFKRSSVHLKYTQVTGLCLLSHTRTALSTHPSAPTTSHAKHVSSSQHGYSSPSHSAPSSCQPLHSTTNHKPCRTPPPLTTTPSWIPLAGSSAFSSSLATMCLPCPAPW